MSISLSLTDQASDIDFVVRTLIGMTEATAAVSLVST